MMQRREFARRLFVGACVPAIPGVIGFPVGLGQDAGKSSRAGLMKVATSRKAVAATVHPLASKAAMNAYSRGGNAVDAAVAASLMLSVVDGHNSGLGGGGLALIRLPDGKHVAIDGRERAPMSVQKDTFIRNGKPDPMLSQTGPLAAATPGLVALLEHISKTYGKVGWRESLAEAAEVAERGFAIDRVTARSIASTADSIRQFAATATVLLDADAQAPKEGTVLVQKDLGRTLRKLADSGAAWFYEGEFAERTASFMREQGGLLSVRDFKEYTTPSRDVVETIYRGHKVIGFPPPSSGGIHVAQMLIMLERFSVAELFKDAPAKAYHLLAEVMKRAMADRAYWLGDADYAEVPLGLLDRGYLADRSRDIDLDKATEVASHGKPPRKEHDLFEDRKHTTHLTAADSSGLVIALTQTVNTSFGSKVMVPGTGVVLNNEMDDFSLAPGVRNAFGLVGSAANSVEPGKRPLSSMSPTIVSDSSGAWRLTCGAAGGPKITTVTLQNIVKLIDLGMSIDEALASPRIHHQWSPDTLSVEDKLPAAIQAELKMRGHSIATSSALAIAQGIMRDSEGLLTAASDPRVPSSASGLTS
ncbi:MAG: gamma-glutamyltransferase [Pirellulales bacterium]